MRERRPRRLSLLVSTVLAATGLAACSLAAGPDASDLTGSWELVAGSVDSEAISIAAGHRMTLSIRSDAVSGKSGCNRYAGRVSMRGRAFSVTELSGTAMTCSPQVSAAETSFLSALKRVTSANRVGRDALTLSGGGAELRFSAVHPTPVGDVSDTRWVLEDLTSDATRRPAGGAPATLELRSDGTLVGSTGCRSLLGRYQVSGDEFLITQLAAGGECPAALSGQDSQVISVLGEGFTALTEDGALVITSTGVQTATSVLGLVYRSGR